MYIHIYVSILPVDANNSTLNKVYTKHLWMLMRKFILIAFLKITQKS